MDTKELAQELKNEVNWQGFFNLVSDLGSQLNDRQLRFLKARLIEMAIAKLSNNIKWVDKIGQDHQLRDIRIETKFSTNCLTTGSGAFKKSRQTGDIKLTNTLGSSDGRSLERTFDFLLLVDTDCVGLVAFEDINAMSNGDGLKSRFNYDVIEFVAFKEKKLIESKQISILDRLDNMLYKIISNYDNDA